MEISSFYKKLNTSLIIGTGFNCPWKNCSSYKTYLNHNIGHSISYIYRWET